MSWRSNKLISFLSTATFGSRGWLLSRSINKSKRTVKKLVKLYLLKLSRPFVNLGIGTSALELELELELELIQQTPLFPVPLVVTWQIKNVISPLSQGLWTSHLTRWWLRLRGLQPQSYMTLQFCGHVTNKKRYISIFTRPMDPKLKRLVT